MVTSWFGTLLVTHLHNDGPVSFVGGLSFAQLSVSMSTGRPLSWNVIKKEWNEMGTESEGHRMISSLFLRLLKKMYPKSFPECTTPDGCRCQYWSNLGSSRWRAVMDANTCPTCKAWDRWTFVAGREPWEQRG